MKFRSTLLQHSSIDIFSKYTSGGLEIPEITEDDMPVVYKKNSFNCLIFFKASSFEIFSMCFSNSSPTKH